MAEVREECQFDAGIDDVWKVVGDFAGLLQALGVPAELEGEGIGQTRTISIGGTPTVERLEERDEDARRIVYSIVTGQFPFTDYRSTMQLGDLGDGRTRLTWSCTFEPAPGTKEEEAAGMIRNIYQGGMAGLKGRFGG